MDKIFIVEDELIVARDLRRTLEKNGHRIAGTATSAEKALVLIKETAPWLVLIDIFLKGDLTGIDLARELSKDNIPFIYVSANSNQQVLEVAKQTNPYGFIVKPFREKDLLVTIDIARYRYESISEIKGATTAIQPPGKNKEAIHYPLAKAKATCNDIVGNSAAMLKVFNLVQQVAPFETSVLLTGESGTGKERIAQCIFQQSSRSHKPFIKINCAAIPSSLIEAELFGHEKGAFTGATDKKPGKFEYAAGGTIFLDEIGDTSVDMQLKLLRVLQEKEIQRIGGNQTIKTDVRVIAATSKNLEKEVAEGRFRLDLYYRLHVFPIELPPLRKRKEDIDVLVKHFIKKFTVKVDKEVEAVSSLVLQELLHYNWPGNIRELEHVIERAILMTAGKTIEQVDLPVSGNKLLQVGANKTISSLKDNEKEYILSVLEKTNGKVQGPGGAAELLGIPASTLHSKIKKLGIHKDYL
ncbi:MAG: sigma-54 dependent transcriptional regulator [Chitinophagaceae bacterium]